LEVTTTQEIILESVQIDVDTLQLFYDVNNFIISDMRIILF